ncbi:MAG: hypothetical protein GX594_09415 [Pirellulaceae bacterium]|nr:hypothetical protein [Pirellulaceae bacterium]
MKTHYLRIPSMLILAAGLVLSSGCGSSLPKTAPVGGRVTYNGKPVVSGTIVFQPAQGRPAMGDIQPDGTYKLTTFESGDGALLGKHRVTIEARNASKPPPMEGPDASNAPPKVEWLVPKKYSNADSSNLTAEVKSGQNNIDFDLPAEPGGSR